MIQDLTPEGLYWVLGHLRHQDEREIQATVWQGDVVATMKRISSVPMMGFEARLDETKEPAAIGGIVPIWPGLCTCWLYGTDRWKEVGREVTRFATKTILPGLGEAGMHRIECRPMVGNSEAVRWLRIIGFDLEATTRAFGRKGEDFYLFARTWRDHGRGTAH